MDNLAQEILEFLKTQAGQGNSNTSKITEKIIQLHPDLDYDRTKIDVVQTLRDLNDNGQIQIMTQNWEFGEEFLYLDSGTKDKIEIL
ncbi:MAG: hypothetical protein AAF462_04815 [Thermodesulfobacteriota bacterium]